jgi:hypothetical protein
VLDRAGPRFGEKAGDDLERFPTLNVMRRSKIFAVSVSIAALVAACGGDDDGGSGPLGAPGADDPAAIPDDVNQALDDAGIDLDDLENLDLDDLENLDLDELTADLDDFASSFGGDGGGTITVAEVTYTVEADVCFVFPGDFTLDGPATGSDGSMAWVDASYSITTREDMAEFVDESQLEFLFPDGTDELVDMTVSVNVGQTGRFESVEDQPAWSAYGGDVIDLGLELDWEFTGSGLRGSGEATDDNYVAVQFGESVPIEFDIGCS